MTEQLKTIPRKRWYWQEETSDSLPDHLSRVVELELGRSPLLQQFLAEESQQFFRLLQ
jgi:hypothetical protein